MRLDPPAEPIPPHHDDDTIRTAVADADLPALLAAVAYATGDLSLLRPEFRPDPARLLEPRAGLTEEADAEARRLAAIALGRYRDAGSPAPTPLTTERLHELIGFLVGPESADAYFEVLREELAVEHTDERAPTWHKDDLAPDAPFTVAIIGAGMSGIAAAYRLGQAGVPFVIFEKNDDVGGTWFENTYPGCRVDVPNHLYSYSFAQTADWPQHFSSQEVLLDYFRICADAFGVRPHIRVGTEVLSAVFDDREQRWDVRVRCDGVEETSSFEAVVSAVGQLNRPSFPGIEGRDRFAGPSFHSAQWDHDVDLHGRRVGVIGTGASAVQFVPVVAAQAAHTVVFQRTAPWLVPTPDYTDTVSEGLRWVLRHVPGYARWDRLWLFWRMHEGLLPLATVDPDWPDQERSVSAANEFLRLLLSTYLDEQFPDPVLRAQVQPTYPPVAKRVLRDDGSWARTLGRADVCLETGPIGEITATGVTMADGTEHDIDVLVYGTGFSASAFLTPMAVTGRDGIDLHGQWDGDARAYLGLTVPGFPNLFLLYGPNTNIVINGSIVYFSECGVQYVLESIRMLLAGGHRSMECRPEVHDAYNERIDAGNRRMAWGATTVNSWYRNRRGRVTQNWPFSLLDYWHRTRRPDPADYTWR